ncbi:MAG: AMP-binding protein, partial [Clostridiales Family XIII bacterium]|nr:AMP-binding protein [Clostridiales Family XIII bacterium]
MSKCVLLENQTRFSSRYFVDRIEKRTEEIAAELLAKRQLFPIPPTQIADQLIDWFAAMEAGAVPFCVHREMPQALIESLCETVPPQGAEFAVLSSGSTGLAKLFFRTTDSWENFFKVQNHIFDINASTRLFFHGSLSFTGTLNMCVAAIAFKAKLVTVSSLNGMRMLESIVKNRVNSIYLVPAKLALLVSAGRNHDAIPGVRRIITGSQLLQKDVYEGLKRVFPNAVITMYYGASESGYVTYITGDDILRFPGCLGQTFPGVEIERSQEGQIAVYTEGGILGMNRPILLPDLGCVDESGRLWLLGRCDEVVNVAGTKINLAYVRETIRDLPEVHNAEVLYTDAGRKARIVAFFEAAHDRPPVDNLPARILEDLNAVLLPGEVPRAVYELPDLPLNAGGKPDRRKLESMLASQEQGAIGLPRCARNDTMLASRNDTMDILPHRGPMLLLDAAELIAGEAHGRKHIRGDEWF